MAPELSADLFHAIPAGIIDPFLYVENGEQRAATVSILGWEHGNNVIESWNEACHLEPN